MYKNSELSFNKKSSHYKFLKVSPSLQSYPNFLIFTMSRYTNNRNYRERDDRANCPTLFVGSLPDDVQVHEIRNLLKRYNPENVTIANPKNRRDRTCNAFVTFNDWRDVDDSCREFHDVKFGGERIQCQRSEKNGGRDYRDAPSDRERQPRKRVIYGEYAIKVTNIPPNTKWYEVKDFAKTIDGIKRADAYGNHAVIEYETSEQYDLAFQQLENKEIVAGDGFNVKFEKYINEPVERENNNNRGSERGYGNSRERDSDGGQRKQKQDKPVREKTCFDYQNLGECKRGDECRYVHNEETKGQGGAGTVKPKPKTKASVGEGEGEGKATVVVEGDATAEQPVQGSDADGGDVIANDDVAAPREESRAERTRSASRSRSRSRDRYED
jgi:RNA recognition motif-containing protein